MTNSENQPASGRPLTVGRLPDGVGGGSFFEKHVPSYAPDWVRTTTIPRPGNQTRRLNTRLSTTGPP
ncbi:MAG: non-homologous end-joining DNA ligase LigD [Acidimicrobiales bacterium]